MTGKKELSNYFCFQIGRELQRNLLADELSFRFGEDLLKETQRLDTLVNVLEFFYTKWSGDGTGTASLQVNEEEMCVFCARVRLLSACRERGPVSI